VGSRRRGLFAAADEKGAEEMLKGKGLRRMGTEERMKDEG